jgi:hypothetical protein
MKHFLAAAAILAGACLPPGAQAQMVNAQTAATYTVANTDCDPQARKLLTFNNAAGVAVTLPQAGGSSGFFGGCVVTIENIGLGTVTVTPTTSTINGVATLGINAGAGAAIYNDSSPAAAGNYWSNVGSAGPAGVPANNFRNLLDNGAMAVDQRVATTAVACGGTTGTTTNAGYSADRWACIANVGSQAGRAVVTTATPSPPTGFSQSLSVYRTSGALTQPVCHIQEVPTADAVTLQGMNATYSFQLQALAGLSADNGNVVNAYIMTGTGTNQGLATMTASPAITPAWTGIVATTTKAITATTSWARYTLTGAIPAAATEIAVAVCFTPTASGSGTTDGFAIVGEQLEAGSFATPFEQRPYFTELTKDEAYFWQLAEPAAGVAVAQGTANTTTQCEMTIPNPVVMRAVPAVLFAGTTLATTTWQVQDSTTASTLASTTFLAQSSVVNTANAIGLIAKLTTATTAGWSCQLQGAGGGSILQVYADF